MGLMEEVGKEFTKFDIVVNLFSMQISWISESFSLLLGYELDELLDTSFRKIISIESKTILKIICYTDKNNSDDLQLFKMKNGEDIRIFASINKMFFEEEPYAVAIIKK